jgi:hypothetical protein
MGYFDGSDRRCTGVDPDEVAISLPCAAHPRCLWVACTACPARAQRRVDDLNDLRDSDDHRRESDRDPANSLVMYPDPQPGAP